MGNTRLITIDPVTDEVTSTKIKTNSKYDFSSFLLDRKIFQTILGKREMSLRVYDLDSGDTLATKKLTSCQSVSPIYFRYGRKNIIDNRVETKSLIGAPGEFEATIGVFKKDERYIIQTGTYYNTNAAGVAISPSALLVSVATTIIYNSIQLAREKPGISRYFYYTWDPSNPITLKVPAIETLKDKIDKYEIEQRRKGVGFKHKTYISYKKGIVCTYYSSNTKTLSLIYFD